MSIRITKAPIDIAHETKELSHGHGNIGAVVTFTGICRGEENGKRITALMLEHYPGMAEAEIEHHIQNAKARWPLLNVHVVHRVGRIESGEPIVFVATASEHRQAAFSAAEFLMDYIKTHAPFWKKVDAPDGIRWIEARADDEVAAERWDKKGDAAE